MIHSIEQKSKREILEIYQVQAEEFQKLQSANERLQQKIKALQDICKHKDAEIERLNDKLKGLNNG